MSSRLAKQLDANRNVIHTEFFRLPKNDRHISVLYERLRAGLAKDAQLTAVNTSFAVGLVRRGFRADVAFADEAQQITEPELLIPLVDQARHLTKVILAGDVNQNAPLIHSLRAEQNPLGDQLAITAMGHCSTINSSIEQTFVNHTYRQHPSLVAMPNKLAYFKRLLIADGK